MNCQESVFTYQKKLERNISVPLLVVIILPAIINLVHNFILFLSLIFLILAMI